MRPGTWWTIGWLVLLTSVGCAGERNQSSLHPEGPAAEAIAVLWWVLFAVCTAVFVLVIVLTVLGISRRLPSDGTDEEQRNTRFILLGGAVMPFVVLTGTMIFSLSATVRLQPPETDLTIQVIGHQWWWEVRYPDQTIITANEIHIPVGRPVRLELTSADVIHSFWVPQLNGKMDTNPGLVNVFWMQANRAGTFRGQCAEYCGLQHANMALVVVAMAEDDFSQWMTSQQQPAREPDTPALSHGQEIFFRKGCHNCHTIRGTEATGQVGPDLTHIGSRLTLAAAMLVNNHQNMMDWIEHAQPIKPGNRMPRTHLEPADVEALSFYLESLR